jgi:hypothetical protein
MKLKPFQREDLARAALVPGLVKAWDTGLGKTFAMFLWPLLRVGRHAELRDGERLRPAKPVLLVAPGDLHDRLMRKAEELFGIRVTLIEDQTAFERLVERVENGRPILAPGFYLTSYMQLGVNGTRPWPDPDDWEPQALRDWLCIGEAGVVQFYADRARHFAKEYACLGARSHMTEAQIRQCYKEVTKDFKQTPVAFSDALRTLLQFHGDVANADYHADLTQSQRDWLTRACVRHHLKEWQHNDGEFRKLRPPAGDPTGGLAYPIKCVYSPTLSDLSWNAFDVVAIDEGVKMKGDDTLISRAVRQMAARNRMVATATPVKNRLPDFFWLAAWVADCLDEPSPRFPYVGTMEDKVTFAKTFLVSERNLTKEQEYDRPFKKLTAQVCNVHLLWKLMAPLVIRRRKEELPGESIVPCQHHIVRVPLGAEQAQVVAYHLEAEYRDRNGRKAIGPQLQSLRLAAACPHSPLLADANVDNHPKAGRKFSREPYTPKIATVLELIGQCLERGEQVLVGAAFRDCLDAVAARLTQAGVPFVVLDGRANPKRRGELSRAFELGEVPVALGGVESMAEGHDFWRCRNAILCSYPWAMDKAIQFVNRIWRLASRDPVNVWHIIADGTMDRRHEVDIQEKSSAAELVLDGRLVTKGAEETSLAELLRTAQREFDGNTKTVCERKLAAEWPALKLRLAAARVDWKLAVPTVQPEVEAPAPAIILPVDFAPEPEYPIPVNMPAVIVPFPVHNNQLLMFA